ncbi:MAG: hypothetical protein WC464_01170 [Bdellovibrionales bacterium]
MADIPLAPPTPPSSTAATATPASEIVAVQVSVTTVPPSLKELARIIQTNATPVAIADANNLTFSTTLGSITVALSQQLGTAEKQNLTQQLISLLQAQRTVTLTLQPGSPPTHGALLFSVPATLSASPQAVQESVFSSQSVRTAQPMATGASFRAIVLPPLPTPAAVLSTPPPPKTIPTLAAARPFSPPILPSADILAVIPTSTVKVENTDNNQAIAKGIQSNTLTNSAPSDATRQMTGNAPPSSPLSIIQRDVPTSPLSLGASPISSTPQPQQAAISSLPSQEPVLKNMAPIAPQAKDVAQPSTPVLQTNAAPTVSQGAPQINVALSHLASVVQQTKEPPQSSPILQQPDTKPLAQSAFPVRQEGAPVQNIKAEVPSVPAFARPVQPTKTGASSPAVPAKTMPPSYAPPPSSPTQAPPFIPQIASLLTPGNEVSLKVISIFPAPSETAARQSVPAPAPNQIVATVVGTGTEGQLILKSGEATLFVKAQVSAPVGATVLLAVEGVKDAPLVTLPTQETPAFEALPQALAALKQFSPHVFQNVMMNFLPRPTEALPAALMFLLSAFKQGNVRDWLGSDAVESLKDAGKYDLLANLTKELGSAGKPAQDAVVGDWRSYPIPLFADQQYQALTLYVHSDRDARKDKSGKPPGLGHIRFLIDMKLSKLGAMQIDGFVKPKKLDMILRSEIVLPEGLHHELRTAYIKALDAAAYAGTLTFQVGRQHWMVMQKAAPQQGIVT